MFVNVWVVHVSFKSEKHVLKAHCTLHVEGILVTQYPFKNHLSSKNTKNKNKN